MVAIEKPHKFKIDPDREKIPRLHNGDRLTRAEFERRYNAMPNTKKAELIEGVVYMPSPVSHKSHGRPHAYLLTAVGVYHAGTTGTDLSDNATVRLDLDNEPQPDILLRIEKNAGGSSIVDEDGYIQGSPELVAEIANSTASYDMHDKLNAYRRNGVQEYLVWLVGEQKIHWFVLNAGEYQQLQPDGDGIVKSGILPGLWLNTKALLDDELDAVLATIQTGLKSSEHKAFVTQLSSTQQQEKIEE